MTPAVGQGAIGIEIRDDDDVHGRVWTGSATPTRSLASPPSVSSCACSKAAARYPIGAYARLDDGRLVMDGMVASIDGETVLRHRLEGSPDEPDLLGAAMTDRLLDMGAAQILEEIRAAADAAGGRVDGLLET